MFRRLSAVGAVLVGAGGGRRMGKDKAFLPLGGRPLLAWSAAVCQDCELIDQIVIVLGQDRLESGRRLVAERGWNKVVDVCAGGERRQDSVRQGLERLNICKWVVIHDCARPFLTFDLLSQGLDAAVETGAAAAAVPVKDTIKLCDDSRTVRETLDRQRLWAVQTPQVFRFDIIAQAHERIAGEVTDDASMVERLGCRVKLYTGSYHNIKLTTPEDLALARMLVRKKQ